MINGGNRPASLVLMIMSIIIQTISTGCTVGLPLELMRNWAPDDASNYSNSTPSSTETAAAATTSSLSSSSSSRLPVLPSPDYLVRLRRNNRTSLFYAYFHSVELEEGEGTNLTLNPLSMRRESGDQHNKEYDDKGAMYFAIVVVLLYGISIALLIASTVRGSRTDDELKMFMRSFAEVNREKWREDRQKVNRILQLHDPRGTQDLHGPTQVLPGAKVDPSSTLLRQCSSSDLRLDGETDHRRCEANPSVVVAKCFSDQPSCETASLFDSVPFVDE